MRAWLPVCLLLAGCADPDRIDSDEPLDTSDIHGVSGCEVGPPPSVEIGKGEDAFEPSETDDGRTVLIHGLQGGFHTFVSIRAEHLAVDTSWYMVIEGVMDDEIRATARLERLPDCNPELARGESIGTWLVWRGRPYQLHNREVTIRAVVVDGDRRLVVGETRQVIWDPELGG